MLGLGLDYGLGLRQDPQLRVSHLATTFCHMVNPALHTLAFVSAGSLSNSIWPTIFQV